MPAITIKPDVWSGHYYLWIAKEVTPERINAALESFQPKPAPEVIDFFQHNRKSCMIDGVEVACNWAETYETETHRCYAVDPLIMGKYGDMVFALAQGYDTVELYDEAGQMEMIELAIKPELI